MTARQILQQFFHYDDFRPLQADIVASVLSGRDTLALMPTGGGKSICFQVPTLALASEQDDPSSPDGFGQGLCLVITPLIALMKDQVENLRQRDIRAAAVYTGMSAEKQRIALDNCLYGPYRFLYCSPERLESEEFRQRLRLLPIRLIAIDEAHCISQWGYDFRPSYLRIADIRALMPEVPVLALTATATPEVVNDIQARLGFREPNVLRMSFHRHNLHYIVRYTEQKNEQMLHILQRVPGTAIVYVRNRKRATELADYLRAQGQSADFYHAGLSTAERSSRQQDWKQDRTRIIVATNAFGMGIDKPDVRLVIHYDLPDTLEAYYQEAGRGGRDGKRAYAVLLYSREDKAKARRRVSDHYPPLDFISRVYHCTCDFLQIGIGSGLNHPFALHLDRLCEVMHLPVLQTYSALHLLDQAGWIRFEEEHETSPRVRIDLPPHQLSSLSLSSSLSSLLDHLMRSHTGIFTDLQYLDADFCAAHHDELVALAQRGILTYLPRTVACAFMLLRERTDDAFIPAAVYDERRTRYVSRLQAMVEYAEQQQFCREQLLLAYFGENDAPVCGHCDCCLSHAATPTT